MTEDAIADYWRDAIGGTYQTVKFSRMAACHPTTIRNVLARLAAGEQCPEAADVIVALVHSQCQAWNVAEELSRQIRELEARPA